jgi:predicted lipid-binding transport protein (Tim44 family)
MAKYLNRWSALCAWCAVMGGVWVGLVPGSLSLSSFVPLALTGAVLLVAVPTFLEARRPAPSMGQAFAQADAGDAAKKPV